MNFFQFILTIHASSIRIIVIRISLIRWLTQLTILKRCKIFFVRRNRKILDDPLSKLCHRSNSSESIHRRLPPTRVTISYLYSLQRGSPRASESLSAVTSICSNGKEEKERERERGGGVGSGDSSFVSILRSRDFYRLARLPLTRRAGGRPRVVVYLRCLPRPFVSPRLC